MRTLVVISVMLVPTVMSFPSTARSADWASCASALDDLSSAASEASDAAERVARTERDFKSAKEEYEQCRRFPDIYDLLDDGCRSKRQDAEDARDELKSRVHRLKGELDDVDSVMSDVESSCGYQLVPATPIPGVSAAHQSLCRTIRRSRSSLPADSLKQLCLNFMSEAECNSCLSAP